MHNWPIGDFIRTFAPDQNDNLLLILVTCIKQAAYSCSTSFRLAFLYRLAA